ncbi:tetratricopeptide repeat protein [Massilia rhizosphaerae]|uniref:tetratricopeptide repeat protein n=1 Tax=Massilia rhizosphaerae TaxID=2784389 RepID=UPI0018DC713C|nr:tetratricopeptide repeat protein [Massilia rhizosphaerae]
MTHAESLFHAARTRLDAGDHPAAAALLRAALALDPDAAAIHANLAFALAAGGDTDAAETHYRRAIALAPHEPQTYLNLGAMLTARHRADAALAVYAAAPAFAQDSPALLSNRGMALVGLGSESEAETCYRRALALDPGYRKAAFNLAYVLLRQGRWAEGWQRLEARDWLAAMQDFMRLPRWDGAPLAGRRILVGVEAGHGDMIQFCRYCDQLKAAGAARVGVLCHPGLAALFGSLRGVDEVISLDQDFDRADWDAWAAPLSLPLHLGTTVDSVPAALPYLAPDPARVARLAPLLGDATDALKVGLVWKGNPRFENDAARSLPGFATLAPLRQVPGVRWFSLQKGPGEDEAKDGVTDLAGAIGDFADTAALIAGLDLVITVDTACAHLAGALGKRCWVLLPAWMPDWRWLADRTDTPWYPHVMRLFRQRRDGAWDEVMRDVAAALAELAAGAAG